MADEIEDINDTPQDVGSETNEDKPEKEVYNDSTQDIFDDAPRDGLSLTAKMIMVVIAVVVFSTVLAPIVSQLVNEQVANDGVGMSLYKNEDIEFVFSEVYADGTPIIVSDVIAVKYLDDVYEDKILKYPKGYYLVGTNFKAKADSVRITTEGNELNIYFGESTSPRFTSEYQWVFVKDDDGDYRATASPNYPIKINHIDNVYVVGDGKDVSVYWSYNEDDLKLQPSYVYLHT